MIRQFKIFITLTITLFSCQKEISVENGTSQTLITSDSIYISKVIGLDTTNAAPFDTIYVANYVYDNLKRVVSYSYLTYGNTGMLDSTLCIIASKKYNGNDTLPYKQITWTKEASTKWIDTSYYQYLAGSTLLIYDSVISKDIQPYSTDIYTSVEKYAHLANTISRSITNYLNNIYTNSNNFSYNLTLQNGNIVTQLDTTWGSSHSFICAYDNKPNPFSRVGISPYSYAGFFDIQIGDTDADPTFYEQKNNILEINNSNGSSSPQIVTHYKYFYKYNTRNYPSEVDIQNVGSSNNYNQNINKIIFKYTN